jgi:hypothetical protein
MSSDVLGNLIGQQVEVHTLTGSSAYKDRGTVERADGHAIMLVNERGEPLVFPIYNIRLIKIISPS